MRLPSGANWVEKEESEGKSPHLVPEWWERGDMGVGGGAPGMSDMVLSEGSESDEEEASSSQESATGADLGLVCCTGSEDRERVSREESRPCAG